LPEANGGNRQARIAGYSSQYLHVLACRRIAAMGEPARRDCGRGNQLRLAGSKPIRDERATPYMTRQSNGDAGPAGWHESTGDVVLYRGATSERAAHDHATCAEIARSLAAIKGYGYAGEYDQQSSYPGRLYFVPTDTLIGVEYARSLGIAGEHDLFGGVVPYPFVATKCISHPLVDDNACAPDGWSAAFAREVEPAVLHGFAAFSADDAMRAALCLFDRGPVRIKRALGIGGFGQTVVNDVQALEQALADADPAEVLRYGIALEQDLADVTTYSVGQVRLDDLLASYCGTQRLTQNNHGQLVYGGSDLLVARGDFDALLAMHPLPGMRAAVEQARVYDAAAFRRFVGLFASRRNYDIAEGTDADGRRRSGVLEQSWRVGGASGAEVAALAAFHRVPALTAVQASSTEVYGDDAPIPDDATVYFQGTDDRAGPLTKYSRVQPHGHA
jgi:hypothetical protein